MHRLFTNGTPKDWTTFIQTPRLVWWEWRRHPGLLEEKHQKHKTYLIDTSSVPNKAGYLDICKTVQTRLRDMQDSWLTSKADEIQSFADRKDMKKRLDALKTVYGPQSSGTTPLLSADGTSLLTDNEAILKRWVEHFDSVLNRPSSINDDAIKILTQMECNLLLDEFQTVAETVKAIQLMSFGKNPGSDAIPAEIYKAGGTPAAKKMSYFTSCITSCGEKKPSLKNWRMRQLSTLSNGKGILSCVIIIVASLYCQLLERSLQEFYLTDWKNTLNSRGFYQKADVDSERTEEQLAWTSQQGSFKRNARNRTWTSTWPLLTLPKHLIQSVDRVFGKLGRSLAVRSSS